MLTSLCSRRRRQWLYTCSKWQPACAAGKAFFRKKKQPVPVDLRSGDWGAQIKRALGATSLFLTGGSCLNLRRAARPM